MLATTPASRAAQAAITHGRRIWDSQLLQELAGVAVDAKQVERTAEALGQEIAEDERHHSEPLDALPLPKTLYLGIDGTGIPLRAEELTDVPGKREGGAKTREVKLCTVWSAESLDSDGTPIRDEGSITYSAAIESARIPDIAKERSAFAQRVWRETQRRRCAFESKVHLWEEERSSK